MAGKRAGFTRLVDGALRLMYPRGAVCIACGSLHVQREDWRLCERCAAQLAEVARPCKPPLPPPMADGLDDWRVAYDYSGVAQRLVQALKYHDVGDAALVLAEGMAAALPMCDYTAIVPVPLHPRRANVRGFNQAMLLSREIATLIGRPVWDALVRVRATRTQTSLSREGRMTNVEGAFEAAVPLEGATLLLVDDVLTTGATGAECAAALRAAGATRVVMIAAAGKTSGEG